mmetsp:Transcript_41063/g.113109  ORF Transcript_41063/g.113109 Transcript_41063/m.113109 type:complete len:302 (+) Transcript_41063:105-1010(+)
MDEARKLLDSLMGSSRDQDLQEQEKLKGKSFIQDSVCKHYLLGFCPNYELACNKMVAKRSVKECQKIHSDAMRAEFEAHPDKEKFQADYEQTLLPVLEALVREADTWVSREQGNRKRIELSTPEKTTVNNMPASVKEEYEQLTQDMNKLMAAAEEIAEKGDVEGSKFKVMLAGEIKSKIKELEDRHIVTYTVTHKEEEVCEVCGARYEAAQSTNHGRYMSHFTGQVHLGYVKIREWMTNLRNKRDKGSRRRRSSSRGRDREKEKERERARRGGSRERTRNPSQSRGVERRPDRSRSRKRRR